MFRQSGYLTLQELIALTDDTIARFGSNDLTTRYDGDLAVAVRNLEMTSLCGSVESAHLINGLGEVATIQAQYFFETRFHWERTGFLRWRRLPPCCVFSPFDNSKSISRLSRVLAASWYFTDLYTGIVSAPALWRFRKFPMMNKEVTRELRLTAQALAPFNGWSVSLNENVVEPYVKSLRKMIANFNIEEFSKGAPDALSPVVACTLTAYPNGKGEATWADVEARVGYSRRSIVRALGDAGQKDWATRGQ